MKIPKLSQLPFIGKVRFSTQVFVVGVILTATFFLLAIDVFKTYTSTISILIIPKSEVAATNETQILHNAIELPRLLSFYDRLLKQNNDVRDLTEGLSDSSRKMAWNKMLEVEKINKDSSVLNISITTSHQSDSELLVKKTARTLFDVMGNYYNIKTDLDLRIVDGPITKSQVSSWFLLLLLSALFGFGLAFVLKLLWLGKKSETQKEVETKVVRKKVWFDFSKFGTRLPEQGIEALRKFYEPTKKSIPEEKKVEKTEEVFLDENYLKTFEQDLKIKEMKKLTQQIEPGKYPNFPEMPIHAAPVAKSESKASAPDNLPIADVSVLEMFGMSAETELPSKEVSAEIVQEKTAPKEPTSEELKKRLNELLKGKL